MVDYRLTCMKKSGSRLFRCPDFVIHYSFRGLHQSDTEVSFSPDQNGTALLAEAGADIAVGKNGTLGVRGGYMHSVEGIAAQGYYGQLNMKIRF